MHYRQDNTYGVKTNNFFKNKLRLISSATRLLEKISVCPTFIIKLNYLLKKKKLVLVYIQSHLGVINAFYVTKIMANISFVPLRHCYSLAFSSNLSAIILSGIKVLYHSVFDLFPLTYMCVGIHFRLFSYQKN